MATGRVWAGFLHTRTRLAGQDPQPGPGPIINRVFFPRPKPAPAWPCRPRLALGPKSGPTKILFIYFKLIKIFCQIHAHSRHYWAANSSPFKPIKIFGIWATLYGSQSKL